MGIELSKPAAPTMHEKAVFERLRDLQLEEGYVQVDSDNEKGAVGLLAREAEGLPVQVLESWQASILKDPKNRYRH